MKNGNNFECPEGAGGGVGEPGFPAIIKIFLIGDNDILNITLY